MRRKQKTSDTVILDYYNRVHIIVRALHEQRPPWQKRIPTKIRNQSVRRRFTFGEITIYRLQYYNIIDTAVQYENKRV